MATRICEPHLPAATPLSTSGKSVLGLWPGGSSIRVRYPGVTVTALPTRAGATLNNCGSCMTSVQHGAGIQFSLDNSSVRSSWRSWDAAAMNESAMPLAPVSPSFRQVTRRNRRLPTRSKFETADSSELAESLREMKASEEGVVCLVLGSGGREHALCYGLRRSPSCAAVFCVPGNPGISSSGDATCVSNLNITDSSAVASFCKEWGVGLVVVGPEGPLVCGLVDDLIDAGIPTFGPSAAAAALEGSKTFMKRLCDKYQIPTAKYCSFTDAEEAKKYIKEQEMPIVVKADGLAAGKGVVIACTLEEAFEAVDSMLVKGTFGSAGGLVVVEEFLDGEEVSFFAIVDGQNAVPLASAQDHKRVGDGDTGSNTGGMGAYSPAPVLTSELQTVIMDSIILPTVKGMAAEGCNFVGVLYAGIIVEKKNGAPKLLEYNVRFGDPECQVLMLRFRSDLVQLLLAACQGQLKGIELTWADEPALVVVMASKGYPSSYQNGSIIRNLDEAESVGPEVKLFYAGVGLDPQQNMVAMGGRVLGAAAMGKDIEDAQRKAYQVVDCINWPEGFCRRDIGWRAVARLSTDTLSLAEKAL